MKALLCRQHGLPDSLVVDEIDDPVADAGEVVVDVRAAGVNFPDVLIIQNKYQAKPALPFAPGAEFSGVVSAVGSGVTDRRIGDRVIGSVTFGAFAEKVKLPASRTFKMPDSLDFERGAAFLLTYGTSYHALVDRAQLAAGETLLVLGAAGGVGLAAIEIGKALGARVIAAASSAEKLAVCREHGADEFIDYTSDDLRERLRAITGGRGPDVIYDPVGGALAEPAFRSIAWRGRYLVVGFAGGAIPALPWNLALLKGAAIVGVFWGDFLKREPQAAQADIRQLFAWYAEGKVKPAIDSVLPMSQVREAYARMGSRQVRGKVVLVNEG